MTMSAPTCTRYACHHLQTDISGKRRVWAVMANGERWEGDILVGADGIHSKVNQNAQAVRKEIQLPVH